ncbi:acyl carrier protein [Caulobacter sp. SLTY]|uniref:acyl carrier protein n=1 Tax=Caulobacter sp. SLTY TaxID=2683262 RepID=UPI0014137033|nr:acyl carrier protein [Caulobacter sp. SLTY]NBB17401.1 acyl carrier protein [Caulobacter sp. SLTY]
MSQIQPELEDILRTLFDEYEGPITGALTAAEVEQWDSLANVQLVVLAERTFGVRFSTAEIAGLANLGALADLIRAKQG